MGNKGDSLVVMGNKDTYYVNTQTAQFIQRQVSEPNPVSFVTVVDIRTGLVVTLNVGQISSVVVRSDDDGIKQ
jgi:hypothetical protein